MRRARFADLGVLALFLLLALVVTGGMLRHPGQELAVNDSDVGLLSWFLQHDAHALAHGGHGLLITDDINAPAGVNLMWNTALLLPGILLAPLTWMAGGRTTFAVLLWLAPALSAYSLYWVLGRTLRETPLISGRTPRIAAGLLFGFSPALLAQSLGHLQMTLLPLVPLILFLVLEAAAGIRRPVAVGAAAGLVASAQLLTGEEVLFFTAFVAVLLVVGLVLSRPRLVTRERVLRFVTITGVALACFTAITALPLLVQLFGAQHVHGTPFTRDYFKLDVSAFTTPTKQLLLSSEKSRALSAGYRGGPEEHTGYLGWALIVLSLVMLVVRWRDLRVRLPILMTVLLSVLALGLHPLVHLKPHDNVTLPWGWLIDLPVFESAIVNRLSLLSALLLAVALAASVEWVQLTSTRLALVVAIFTLLPLVPQPLPVSPRPPVPAFFAQGARELPAGSTVVIAPPAGYGHVDAMRWQAATDFRFKLAGGYFIGPSYDNRAVFGPLPRTLLYLLDQIRDKGQLPTLTADQRSAIALDLDFYDASAVIVGPMPHEDVAVAFVSDVLGRAPEQVGGVNLWRL
ncbi:MAG: hypothetical protein QOE64_105 [Frankiales bacterium]|jgi:hypothetical protein|nr:hypothetical protein [Frankiales bacterium]